MKNEISEVKKPQIKEVILSNQKAFKAVLPKNFPVEKFMATLWQEVQKNPKLGECTNLIEIAKDVASFGLVVGGLANQAYLIPFKKNVKSGNNWSSIMTAQLIIGYKGYITKLEESGYHVEAEIVTKQEIEAGCFEEIRGSETRIIHKPIRNCIRNRESIALAYCIIKSANNPPIVSVLSKEEIEEMAKTEKFVEEGGKKSKVRELGNVWTQNQRETDFGQMCIKTAIRNAVKRTSLRIVNEMSAYEGKRDEEMIKDITPSKTAAAHFEQAPELEINEELVDVSLSIKKAITYATSIEAVDKILQKNQDLLSIKDNDPEAFNEILAIAESKKASFSNLN